MTEYLKGLTDREREILKEEFRPDAPLGNTVAPSTFDRNHQMFSRAYFEATNHPYQQMARNPSMIVGRRGAGKTEMLLSCHLDDRYHPIVYFNSDAVAAAFQNVLRDVEAALYESYAAPLAETVAQVWSLLFSVALFDELVRTASERTEEIELCERYLAGIGLQNSKLTERSPYRVMTLALNAYKTAYNSSQFKANNIDFAGCFRFIEMNGIAFEDVETLVINYLERSNQTAIILCDSIEGLDIRQFTSELALQGLLRCIGEFYKAGRPFQLRACIPAEIYFFLQRISSNVLKDFRRAHLLHWSALEILKIAAKRYSIFLELYYPPEFRERFSSLDLAKRTDVMRFWRQVLPREVRNTAGDQREDTLTYILRHTQLLPRQLLLIFGRMISVHLAGRGSVVEQVAEGIVTQAVGQAEEDIAAQIVGSYELIYYNIHEALNAFLPGIDNNIMSYSDMHHRFNNSAANGLFPSFADFVRMGAEVGVFGRVIAESPLFVTGAFEYGEPHRLLLTDKDMICIHPVFTEVYRAIVKGRIPKEFKPVYPRGIDPDEEDRRPLEEWRY